MTGNIYTREKDNKDKQIKKKHIQRDDMINGSIEIDRELKMDT